MTPLPRQTTKNSAQHVAILAATAWLLSLMACAAYKVTENLKLKVAVNTGLSSMCFSSSGISALGRATTPLGIFFIIIIFLMQLSHFPQYGPQFEIK